MSSRRRNGTQSNGGRPRFDRAAAFAFYVALGPGRTKRAVAAEFQVSEQTIGKWSRLEEWDEKAEAIDAKAAAKAEEQAERSLEERRSRVIAVAEKLVDRVLDAELAELDLTAAIRSIPRYAHFQELYAGEATDRISLAEVAEFRTAVLEAVTSIVDRVSSGELAAAEARQALAEELQRRAGEIAAREEAEAV